MWSHLRGQKAAAFLCTEFLLSYWAAKSLQSCPTLCDPIDGNPLGSSVPGILQAGILEWVAISSSRGFSQPQDGTCVSCIGRWILYRWATWEAPGGWYPLTKTGNYEFKLTHIERWCRTLKNGHMRSLTTKYLFMTKGKGTGRWHFPKKGWSADAQDVKGRLTSADAESPVLWLPPGFVTGAGKGWASLPLYQRGCPVEAAVLPVVTSPRIQLALRSVVIITNRWC